MASSDEEYIQDLSDNELLPDASASTSTYGTRSSKPTAGATAPPARKERWEDIQRSWDTITEDPSGSLSSTLGTLASASKRARLLKDTTPLQRGIIRHVMLIIDLSSAMAEKDLRPSRLLLTLRYAAEFVADFFEQNPISQLGVLGMRDGLTVRVSELSGNPAEHIAALQALRTTEPSGNPSLQNALEAARAALFHTPSHGTREIVIVFGALLSADPGDIHGTIRALVSSKIRVSVVGLAARIAICTDLVAKTNGIQAGSTGAAASAAYGVALHEQHFRDLLFAHTTPPAIRASDAASAPSLLTMGFPSRVAEASASLCACHGVPSRGGYACPRCKSKVCGLPSQCPVCELQLIQSTHLARSYHHLFPLRNYEAVDWEAAGKAGSLECKACLMPFPGVPAGLEKGMEKVNGSGDGAAMSGTRGQEQKNLRQTGGASESSRYRCTTCNEHFCIDCDVFAHEVTHNCAGCLSRPVEELMGGAEGGGNGESNGNGHQNGDGHAMDVDMNGS